MWRYVAWPACALLAACSDPLGGPIDLYHGIEGGQIASHRPPPPGLGEPYPKLGTVPPKPVVADAAYRRALLSQLSAERDRTERVAADRPIENVPPPPPPVAPPASASPVPPAPGADGATPPPASASLDTAEAPPPPLQPSVPAHAAVARPSAGLTGPTQAIAANGPPTQPSPADVGPPAGAPLTIAGAPPEFANLPDMPEVPPPPASFQGVAAEPAPTPPRLPARLPALAAGTPIFFPTASAALPASQAQPLRDFLSHRHGQAIEIVGLGDAASDTPEGQATAIALGLARARAVAAALADQHVPPAALRLGADAFGRGAVLRLLP